MSGDGRGFIWLLWALDVQCRQDGHLLSPREHQVLIAVARHANPNREVWPVSARPPSGAGGAAWMGIPVLGADCRCGHDAVNNALRGLERHRLLVSQRRPNASTIYWLLTAWLSEQSDNHCSACDKRRLSEQRRVRPSGRPDSRESDQPDMPSSERPDTPSSDCSDTEVPGGTPRENSQENSHRELPETLPLIPPKGGNPSLQNLGENEHSDDDDAGGLAFRLLIDEVGVSDLMAHKVDVDTAADGLVLVVPPASMSWTTKRCVPVLERHGLVAVVAAASNANGSGDAT